MDLKRRFQWITIIMLLVPVSLLSFFVIMNIKRKGQEDIRQYEKEELHRIKTKIKSYVDIAYTAVDNNFKNAASRQYIEGYYEDRLTNIIDIAESTIIYYDTQVDSGRMTLEQAKREAAETIRMMRYDETKNGYIWINDNTHPYPTMIMNPARPDLEGRVLDDAEFETAMGIGENLFKAAVELCEEKKSGFIDYLGPDPHSGEIKADLPKISYVRIYRPWGWILGTGIYIDDAIRDAVEKSRTDVERMRYDNGTGYFYITDTTSPIPRIVLQPTAKQLEGKILDGKKFNCAMGTDKNMFAAMLEVAMKNGSGFVDYYWDKPSEKGVIEGVPKLSYVKLYEPLEWIIGTGVYLDDLQQTIDRKTRAINKQVNRIILETIGLLVVVLVLGGGFVIFIYQRYNSEDQEETPATETRKKPDPDENIDADASGKDEKKQPEKPSSADPAIIEAVRDINKVIIEEQTRLLAYNKALEASSKTGQKDFDELSGEIRKLLQEVKDTARDIKDSMDDSQKRE